MAAYDYAAGSRRETYLRSLCGPQADSRKESAPSHVFGTGDRSGAFTNQGGGTRRSVGLSPGPIYLPSPRGAMGDGPKFSIGRSAAGADTRRAGAPPGPGEYETADGIGDEQGLSRYSTAPRYGWGTGGRDKLAAGGLLGLATVPACIEFYELVESIGSQPVSTKRTQAAYSLSVDSRFDDRQKARAKAAEPGPGAYRAVGGTGMIQVDSTRPTQPQVSFSRSARLPRSRGASANAALAGDLRSAVGRQVLSERRSKPQYGFGSARRFQWDRPQSARASTPGPGAYNA